jgi:hypothetical protein
VADFGTPTTTTGYVLCVFDGAGGQAEEQEEEEPCHGHGR